MKALVYTKPYEILYREVPDPVPGPGEVVVKMEATGICGSDLHAYHGYDPRRVPPLILGHEIAGKVMTGDQAGAHVALNPLITCGTCEHCRGRRSNLCQAREMIGMSRGGAYAEMVTIPAKNLIPMPEGMDWVAASIMEPTATMIHALDLAKMNLRHPFAEMRILVIGGGAIGLLAALLLRSYGAQDTLISEINPLRQESVAKWTDYQTHNPSGDLDLPQDEFDLVVDAVGGSTTRDVAMKCVKPGGVILHIGLMDAEGGLDVRKLTLSEITLIGVYTYTPEELKRAIHALHDGSLGSLEWIEVRRLAEGSTAFEDLDSGRAAAAKIVLIP